MLARGSLQISNIWKQSGPFCVALRWPQDSRGGPQSRLDPFEAGGKALMLSPPATTACRATQSQLLVLLLPTGWPARFQRMTPRSLAPRILMASKRDLTARFPNPPPIAQKKSTFEWTYEKSVRVCKLSLCLPHLFKGQPD